MIKYGVGQPVRGVEDERLVRGAGKFTSDVAPEGSLFAHFMAGVYEVGFAPNWVADR